MMIGIFKMNTLYVKIVENQPLIRILLSSTPDVQSPTIFSTFINVDARLHYYLSNKDIRLQRQGSWFDIGRVHAKQVLRFGFFLYLK